MSETVKEKAYGRLAVSFQKKPCYDIVLEHSFERLPEESVKTSFSMCSQRERNIRRWRQYPISTAF